MRPYEICLILNASLSPEEADQTLEKVKGIIQSSGGEVAKVDNWGKKRFSYPIADQIEGLYYILNLQASVNGIAEIKRVFKLTPEIVRCMVVRQ